MQLASYEMDFTNTYSRYLQDGGFPIGDDHLNECVKGLVEAKFMTLWNRTDDMGTAKVDWPGMYVLGSFMPQTGSWGVGSGRRVRDDRHVAD